MTTDSVKIDSLVHSFGRGSTGREVLRGISLNISANGHPHRPRRANHLIDRLALSHNPFWIGHVLGQAREALVVVVAMASTTNRHDFSRAQPVEMPHG